MLVIWSKELLEHGEKLAHRGPTILGSVSGSASGEWQSQVSQMRHFPATWSNILSMLAELTMEDST